MVSRTHHTIFVCPVFVPGGLPLHFIGEQVETALETLAFVAYKPIHYRAAAILLWLAVLAVGSRHLAWATGLTLLVCFGIEVTEATVFGHIGRLADMLSSGIGTCIGILAYIVTRTVGRTISNT